MGPVTPSACCRGGETGQTTSRVSAARLHHCSNHEFDAVIDIGAYICTSVPNRFLYLTLKASKPALPFSVSAALPLRSRPGCRTQHLSELHKFGGADAITTHELDLKTQDSPFAASQGYPPESMPPPKRRSGFCS